jgi:uncharacterized paraquat-inducible protein A
MYCTHCGKEVPTNASICVSCRRPVETHQTSRQVPGKYGVTALTLGVLSWAFVFTGLWPLGIALGVLAIAFGTIGLRLPMRGWAIAGSVLGGLCVVAFPLLWFLRVIAGGPARP